MDMCARALSLWCPLSSLQLFQPSFKQKIIFKSKHVDNEAQQDWAVTMPRTQARWFIFKFLFRILKCWFIISQIHSRRLQNNRWKRGNRCWDIILIRLILNAKQTQHNNSIEHVRIVSVTKRLILWDHNKKSNMNTIVNTFTCRL